MGKYNKTSIGENYAAEHRRKRNWKSIVAVLSCFVIVATVSALTLPAITMNQLSCGLEEHQHSPECFGEKKVLTCNAESLNIHQHTDSCFDSEGNVICHYADFVIHEHDDACRDAEGNLVCTLKEVKEHRHNDSCYQVGEEKIVDAGHTHSDECYQWVQSETTVCGLEASEGHTHSDACHTTESVLICTDQDENHVHGEGCYENQDTLICGEEESTGHQHTAECYEQVKGDLICTEQERDPVTESGEKILICDKQEAQVHIHEKGVCYNGNGSNPNQWQCDKLETQAHQHAEECFTTEQVAICGKTEHTHDESCKQDTELSEEEQRQVDDVISIIEGLPPVAEIEAQFDALAEDADALAAYREKIIGAIQTAFDEYNALTDEQKAAVTNAEKLDEYRYLLDDQNVTDIIAAIENLPSIEEIEAELERLKDDPEALAEYQEQLIASIETVSDAYNTLTEEQKASITNAEKLMDYLVWLESHGYGHERVYEVKQYTDGTYTETLTDSPVAVTLTGRLPVGAEVRSYPVEFNMGEEGPVLFAQDITIYLADGTEYQPEQAVTVSVSGLSIPDHQELDVFHDLEDEWGGMERMAYTIDGNSVSFQASTFSTYAIIDAYTLNRIAEPANNPGVIDSGWINYWSDKLNSEPVMFSGMDASTLAVDGGNGKPSDEQVTNRGGSNSDGTVNVSKTIQGTDVENVFDITLTVDTTTNITEILQEPDMAVVIVMDISNTMNDSFGGGTRYTEAVAAAETFMDKFAANNKGYSKLGYVAFNTDAHEIFGLSKCTTAEVNSLKNTLRTSTGSIMNSYKSNTPGYDYNWKRFTNVEAGLKRANDMLASATNKNKYIIFLSDGFPTTYCKPNSYEGYNTYVQRGGTPGTDGYFHDFVNNGPCLYGVNYSDKAAIRARNMANTIKASGTTIYSIGIEVGGQTIDGYDTHRNETWSTLDRTSYNYEIGSANSDTAYKNWLGNSIGSGYYYDSTDTSGLQAAYDAIFEQIKSTTEQANNLKWIASDPMPVGGTLGNEVTMEFIGFFDKNSALQVYPPETGLTGSGTENAENTASFDAGKSAISWDIKNSGYTTTGSGNSTTYHYTVTCRVRLRNELEGFVENQSYQTNGKTTLTYQEITVVDGKETISGDKTIEFPIPEVKGYLGELTFKKVDDSGGALQGAEFMLKHDADKCKVCRGDNKTSVDAVANKTYTATSGEDGIVTFSGLPSGHYYVLQETKAPSGYQLSNAAYSVKIAYNTVTVKENGEETMPWNFGEGKIPEVTNYTGAVLPQTGGSGTSLYIFSGLMLMGAAALIYSYRCKKRKGAR